MSVKGAEGSYVAKGVDCTSYQLIHLCENRDGPFKYFSPFLAGTTLTLSVEGTAETLKGEGDFLPRPSVPSWRALCTPPPAARPCSLDASQP